MSILVPVAKEQKDNGGRQSSDSVSTSFYIVASPQAGVINAHVFDQIGKGPLLATMRKKYLGKY